MAKANKDIDAAVETLVQAKVEKIENENKVLSRKHELLLEHVDVLLKFVEHERTSCSDENLSNEVSPGDPVRCSRCQLLAIKTMCYNDEWVLQITLEHQAITPLSQNDIDRIRSRIKNI